MTAIACLDVGGTDIKSGLLIDGELHHRSTTPTPRGEDVVERLISTLADLVETLAETLEEHAALSAVGLVVPGIVDAEQGIGIWSQNLGWRDAPLRDLLAERTGLPVAFGHDVRAGGLAESRLGAAVGEQDAAFVAVGTGIAAAFTSNGTVFERPRPIGELGHVDVGHDEPCSCGLTGCLEAIASAFAISRRHHALTGHDETAQQIAARVEAGDEDAIDVWGDAVAALACAIAWLAALGAPQVVVIGGGLSNAGETLLAPLRSEVEQRLSFHTRPRIVRSRLGGWAACHGAGLIALDQYGATA